MEAQDALKASRSAFENELNDLISDAGDLDSMSHNYALEQPPLKRSKTDRGSHSTRYLDDDVNLRHKSSKILLDRSNIQQLRSAFPGNSPKASNPSIYKPVLKATPRNASSSQNSTPPTQATLTKTIHRPLTSVRDDLAYEQLLDQRRREKLQRVDRYVPDYHSPRATQSPPPFTGTFPLSRLPEVIVKKIFHFSLVKSEPITINVSALRSFVKERTGMPVAMQTFHHQGAIYPFPVPWNQLDQQIDRMREDLRQPDFKLRDPDLKNRKPYRSPGHGLDTALLHVSREVHRIAAEVFYAQNVFKFPCTTSAWMLLDSFLSTIGADNVARIEHIHIHVPLWHRGIHEDYIEGNLIDILSPATHLRAVKPESRDRLLSAIQHVTQTLPASNPNLILSLSLENGIAADYWTGRYVNDKRLISLSDAEAYVERKRQGIGLLKDLSEVLFAMGNKTPLLTLSPVSQCMQADKKEFRRRFAGLVEEAERYGWEVEPTLKSGR